MEYYSNVTTTFCMGDYKDITSIKINRYKICYKNAKI